MGSDKPGGAENQQGSPRDPSETRRRTPAVAGDEMVRATWRHVETGGDDQSAEPQLSVEVGVEESPTSNSPKRNSLSGKNDYLPRRSARDGRVPAHIGEAFLAPPDGDPEGSPSDPVTTDPKGEARRVVASPRERAAGNTPALTRRQRDTYGVARALDPWYVTGLTEGEGCFCVSFAVRAKLKTGLEARPSFSLSLNRKDRELLQDLQAFFGCGWIRESRSDRTFKYEARSIGDLVDSVVPHFEEFPLRGDKAGSFDGFSRICRMIEQGGHLERQGMREIVTIAYEMNLGKRRHSQAALLRVLGEVKG
jgi:hypothetical protein